MHTQLINYKNFQISSELSPIIKYMEPVEESREKLNDLTKNWDSLSLLSQLGDAGVDMSKIKHSFTTLSSELINYLGTELLRESVGEINSKAQVAVDIVIRNLFERTADIGFLATDAEVRDLLLNNPTRYTDEYSEHLEKIRERFIEYVQKYSVYFDIILMNTNGDILANIDDDNTVSKSTDPIITQALSTSEEYVESFKYHDFLPQHKQSLVYSYRMTEDNDPNSNPLGVLCLCFKFEDEMREIFTNLVNTQKKECITLLDKDGRVIATSDEYHIPLEAKLETVLDKRYKIVSHGGRDYIAKSCETNGYQGFEGLGWYGHIMVPLDHAFNDMENTSFEISQELLLAILQHGDQFSDELKNIPIQASNIQNNLNRAIWNGNVKQSNSTNNNKQFSRALLQEIRKTGENTKNIIGSSMASLTKTMVLGDSVFLADLIVDIMDRNLYERANDCRWWALTSDFRKILENSSINGFDREKMSAILAYINDLYTVYTNLFIYDKNGVVIAVSKKSEEYLLGHKLSDSWINDTLHNTDSSKYFVSAFEQSNLYEGKHTYIYNASIRSLEDEERVLGGIGIVFDSQAQFKAMIDESLPKGPDKCIKEGLFAVLATSDHTVIASNSEAHRTGTFLQIDEKFFKLQAGESLSEIIEYEGKYYALGVQCSKGYREYKSEEDDYTNHVYAFVFSYISDVTETRVEIDTSFALEKDISMEVDENSVDIASFMIGSQWLGVHAHDIIEAVSIDELKSTIKIDDAHHFKGTLIYKDALVSVIDIKKFIQEENHHAYEEVIILRLGNEDSYIGILVNSLDDIPEIHTDRVKSLQDYIVGEGTLAESVVFPLDGSKEKDVLTILSIHKIDKELVRPEQTHMIPRKASVA
jgi:chemotaxis signal transduction protein